jgi:macrolide transport system ATP-binding/permease protein
MWGRLLVDVRGVRGVRSASLSAMTPLDGWYRSGELEAPGFQARSDQDNSIGINIVSEAYFATLGTPVLQGREFTENDRPRAPGVAVINESARLHFFSGRDPIGAVVSLNGGASRIIGVVQDVKQADLRREAGLFIYVPARQFGDQESRMTLSIRTAADPQTMIGTVTRRVVRIRPGYPHYPHRHAGRAAR